jgi:acyl carrier protein
MLTRSTINEAVHSEIKLLLTDTLEHDETIRDSSTFSDLGLNSLMLARLVIALEEEFTVDPFSMDRSIVDVHTVGDLVEAYELALGAFAAAGQGTPT